MPRVSWPLIAGGPRVHLLLAHPSTGSSETRIVLADTGAGSARAPFDLVISIADHRRFGGRVHGMLRLGGAIRGQFELRTVSVRIPGLAVNRRVTAVGVPPSRLPAGTDGIAAFRFLNGFCYGNFGDPGAFGLEVP